MRRLSVLPQMTLLGALLLSVPLEGFGSDEAMLKLFKILRDRGSISEAEYEQLAGMTAKEQAKESQKPVAGGVSASALSAMDKMEQRLKKGEERLAAIEHGGNVRPAAAHGSAQPTEKWYEKIKIDGYTQFRHTGLLNDEAETLNVPNDRSVSKYESMIMRRGRFNIYGDITEHLYLYSQLDFDGSFNGSGGSFGLQARDLYADISFDKDKEYRLRLGLSKVPYGWVNMQSSQNRAAMERPDALNSAVEGERDQGAYFMYTPKIVRERLRELVKSGLKGSGDYGMFNVGVFSGQGLNKADLNGDPHVVARLTYPWKFPNGQFFETSINAYTGNYVVSTKAVKVDGKSVTPEASSNGNTDQRIGVSAILYPQPFGLEAEWNWGRSPELSDDYRSIDTGNLSGGYVQANYRLKTDFGEVFPFARWNYYDGPRKFAANAPGTMVNELDFGFEWSPLPEIELSVMYTHTFERTNSSTFPYDRTENADRLALQVQWNY